MVSVELVPAAPCGAGGTGDGERLKRLPVREVCAERVSPNRLNIVTPWG